MSDVPPSAGRSVDPEGATEGAAEGAVEGAADPPCLRDSTTPGLPVYLSTEHWSLLGTRSMTWSEIMSRITIYLTVVSAFLVVLALTAQATGFGTPFRVMAVGFASAALVMGSLTAIRVNLASREDADLIRAMNRLRHAYVELAPERRVFAGPNDDERFPTPD
ncbi:hypothetical protein AB4Z14_14090 [Terrabacter sp. 2TAF16]|uniref:hypothetical protein n=1 Tax=Terrabacter sp. 2TAF16 TaxID=3233008 RepID=UPI003F9BC3CD